MVDSNEGMGPITTISVMGAHAVGVEVVVDDVGDGIAVGVTTLDVLVTQLHHSGREKEEEDHGLSLYGC